MRPGLVGPYTFLSPRPATSSSSLRRVVRLFHNHQQQASIDKEDEDHHSTNLPPQDSYHARLVAQGHRPPLVLDVSPREMFARHQQQLRRLPNILAVSVPLAELSSRLYELPPPHEAVLEVGGQGKADVGIAKHLLESAGWRCNVAFQDHGAELDLYVTAAAAKAGAAADTESAAVAAAARWQRQQRDTSIAVMRDRAGDVLHLRPNPFLHMAALELIDWKALFLSSSASSSPSSFSSAFSSPLVMIDLGCGSGRDAFFLAEQAQLHCHALHPNSHQRQQVKVLAIDNHGDALERTATLAARGGVDNILECVRMDLRRPRVSKDLLERQPKPSLVHAARFLERRLLDEWLTNPNAVAPGGYVIWSTFRDAETGKGERNAAPPFATSRRLRRGELGSYFRVLGEGNGEGLYDVLHEEEGGQLATRGMVVPASFVVARRRNN